jgi:hypothetical protein
MLAREILPQLCDVIQRHLPMLPLLLILPLLLLVVSARPAQKCGVLLTGLLACTAVASAQQLLASGIVTPAGGPELVVTGGTALEEITVGDLSPALKDGTFISPQVIGTTIARSFALANTDSTRPLNVTAITLTGWSSNFFSLEAVTINGQPQSLPFAMAPGQQAIISIHYRATAVGKHTTKLTIHNNDEDEGLFTFALQASTILDLDLLSETTEVPLNQSQAPVLP